MSIRMVRLISLVWLSLLSSICNADTIIGASNDVTAVDNLQIAYGGTTYVYDVSFIGGATYNTLFAHSPPTFLNNFQGAQLAATALAYTFLNANVNWR